MKVTAELEANHFLRTYRTKATKTRPVSARQLTQSKPQSDQTATHQPRDAQHPRRHAEQSPAPKPARGSLATKSLRVKAASSQCLNPPHSSAAADARHYGKRVRLARCNSQALSSGSKPSLAEPAFGPSSTDLARAAGGDDTMQRLLRHRSANSIKLGSNAVLGRRAPATPAAVPDTVTSSSTESNAGFTGLKSRRAQTKSRQNHSLLDRMQGTRRNHQAVMDTVFTSGRPSTNSGESLVAYCNCIPQRTVICYECILHCSLHVT